MMIFDASATLTHSFPVFIHFGITFDIPFAPFISAFL